MLLRFTKMHGLGNDFMVIDLVTQHAQLSAKQIRQWGDRHTGVRSADRYRFYPLPGRDHLPAPHTGH